jgi:hypothetical protein
MFRSPIRPAELSLKCSETAIAVKKSLLLDNLELFQSDA